MKSELLVLNRQNTMLYRSEDKTFIKSPFKEVEIKLKENEHQILCDILLFSQEETSINELNKTISHGILLKKLMKVLYECGSIFIYKNQLGEDIQAKGWFRILSQYLPYDYDLWNHINLVNKSNVYISNEVQEKFPDLLEVLSQNGISTYTNYNDFVPHENENSWTIAMVTEYQETETNLIQMTITEVSINGVTNRQHVSTIEELSYDRVKWDSGYLLYKIAPFYISIYTMKSIFGLSFNSFRLNEEGRFFEQNLDWDNRYEVIPEIQVVVPDQKRNKIDFIHGFESFIMRNLLPLRISGHKDDYSELYQVGFSTFGLQEINSNKLAFVLAGIDYEETAVASIKWAMERHLNIATNNKWLVTDTQEYYLDKTMFLLNHLEEPYQLLGLSLDSLPNDSVAHVYNSRLNLELKVFIKRYTYSSSFSVYLQVNGGAIYSDERKTSDLYTKIDDLFLNILLQNFNSTIEYQGILKEIVDLNIDQSELIQEIMTSTFQTEQAFIENALALFQKYNIRYNERSWIHESELHRDCGLIARQITVGAYL
ncbi:hypothetical protein [Paenibacillus sp. TSA_86.1]|uniref:hypothetical protein n=1 Tax=Paenibacillus sp. TSA_86.1 TaxID=3415649 RepID=UPI004045A48D